MGGKFTFMSSLMIPNNSYEFTVNAKKGSRQGKATHILQVANSDPPTVLIEYVHVFFFSVRGWALATEFGPVMLV